MLTERQSQLVESVKSNIKCTIDKKTDVIKITVKDQDPLISATLVESVRQRLQKFITEYRTSKARSDYEYYEKLTQEALEEYNKAIAVYSEYSDNHRNAILQAYISERDNLENDMQVKFNAYNALNTQLQAAKAKYRSQPLRLRFSRARLCLSRPRALKNDIRAWYDVAGCVCRICILCQKGNIHTF